MKIFIIGFMGAGKSTAGRKLAARMNFCFLDTDTLIEKREKKSIPEIFKENGEHYFRIVEREILLSLTEYDENLIVSTGGGAPCYSDNMKIMNSSGITVYLKLDPLQLFHRLRSSYKRNRPLIQDKSPEELMFYIIDKLAERELFYNRSRIIFPGEPLNIRELESRILSFRDDQDAST